MMQNTDVELGLYAAPGEYVDSEHPSIVAKALDLTAAGDSASRKAQAIFYFVRDLLYHAADFANLESYRASAVLAAGHGYCGAKASLFAALCRASAIPARLAYTDVSNHISTSRVKAMMGTDVFAWHGYNEVWLDGRWVKVSPTFNASLCRKLAVRPLEFDGRSDAVLQAFDSAGRAFMSYDRHHGVFHDVPARFLAREMQRLYPTVCRAIQNGEFPLPQQ
jgi:transglutaminase-like putative cysteine protease